MDGRKDYEELLKHPIPDETMPVRDRDEDAGARHYSSDAKPDHREDFVRLTNAAARKRSRAD